VSNEIKKNCPSCFVLHKPTECLAFWDSNNKATMAFTVEISFKNHDAYVDNWPADRRLPTIEEFEAARQRYIAYAKDNCHSGREFCCGDFSHVLKSFSAVAWMHFFFPDETPTTSPWPYGKLDS
jgi:hypothetical protein